MTARKVIKTATPPNGLSYYASVIADDVQAQLLNILRSIEYDDFVLHDKLAKRKVRHFGYSYEFFSPSVINAEPFPNWLIDLRNQTAELASLNPEQVEQALIAFYPAGSGIGWHRDAPAFGPIVIGISLGSDEVIRFRRETNGKFEMYKLLLERGSVYVIAGAARSTWQHSIATTKNVRYSITFRSVRPLYKSEK
jgi:alkylated DNA repair protein (DNA oxidative demethylase)